MKLPIVIDAGRFQNQLGTLAEAICQRLMREGDLYITAPPFVVHDIFVQLRIAKDAYKLILYLFADDRRMRDPDWCKQYSVLALTSVRTIIDCFYNLTLIMKSPEINGTMFRLSGLRKLLLDLQEDKKRFSDRSEWLSDLQHREALLERQCQLLGKLPQEVLQGRFKWNTLGRHLHEAYGKEDDIQAFLRHFTLGSWGAYSGLAHATYDGVFPNSDFLFQGEVPSEKRAGIEGVFHRVMTWHITRAASVLLCIVTELQVRYSFPDRRERLNPRIREVWAALLPMYEVQEFYVARYRILLTEAGIGLPDESGFERISIFPPANQQSH